MKDKTIEAAREMIDMLATQDDTHPPVDPKRHPLQYMFQSAWHRFKAVSGIPRHNVQDGEMLLTSRFSETLRQGLNSAGNLHTKSACLLFSNKLMRLKERMCLMSTLTTT